MGNSKINAEILNDLIQINNDRIAGYEKAMAELEPADSDLKALFVKMIGESHKHKLALATEVQALGTDVDHGTTNSGKIYRTWMDVKAIFTGHDRKTVLENCEFGEDAAQKAYKTALEEEDLSEHLRALIAEQKAELRVSHDQIKSLRDMQAS
ncbi:ferritin-like domain-containing protein [Pedobacter sp.]|uniref:ferritin-like domain-containing protein n=1 Tax=Pedobacter sp. TaxID=1411316 RepID=UPI003D7F8557